jgi:hypothetical protein
VNQKVRGVGCLFSTNSLVVVMQEVIDDSISKVLKPPGSGCFLKFMLKILMPHTVNGIKKFESHMLNVHWSWLLMFLCVFLT